MTAPPPAPRLSLGSEALDAAREAYTRAHARHLALARAHRAHAALCARALRERRKALAALNRALNNAA